MWLAEELANHTASPVLRTVAVNPNASPMAPAAADQQDRDLAGIDTAATARPPRRRPRIAHLIGTWRLHQEQRNRRVDRAEVAEHHMRHAKASIGRASGGRTPVRPRSPTGSVDRESGHADQAGQASAAGSTCEPPPRRLSTISVVATATPAGLSTRCISRSAVSLSCRSRSARARRDRTRSRTNPRRIAGRARPFAGPRGGLHEI